VDIAAEWHAITYFYHVPAVSPSLNQIWCAQIMLFGRLQEHG